MTRETMGAKHKYAQSLIPSQARLLASLPPEKWNREIELVCADFCTHYFDNESNGRRQFKDTMAQALTLAQVAGASPKTIVSARLLVEALANGKEVNLEGTSTGDPEVDDFFAGLDDEDINQPPPITLLRNEMSDLVRACASKWTEERPFYVVRSEVDAGVLLVCTSVGRDAKTGVKTNVNGAIGAARNLNEIDSKFAVPGTGTANEDAAGRAYFVRALRILDGSVLRFWLSKQDTKTRAWEQVMSCRLELNSTVPQGFVLQQ